MRTRTVLLAVGTFGLTFFLSGLPLCVAGAALLRPDRFFTILGTLVLFQLLLSVAVSAVFAWFAVIAEVGDRGLSRVARRKVVVSSAVLGALALMVPLMLFLLSYLS